MTRRKTKGRKIVREDVTKGKLITVMMTGNKKRQERQEQHKHRQGKNLTSR